MFFGTMFGMIRLDQKDIVMKTLITILGLGLILSLNSCFIGDEGPRGPQGIQGQTGDQGEPGAEGFVFEYENVSFTGPEYEIVLDFNGDFNFEGLDSDVALVYFLWDTEVINGETLEIWRALPQSIITPSGLLQYNYDFTKYDVSLFLDAEFPLDDLTAADTDDWIVRIVVVPGKFWNSGGRKAMPSYEEVKAEFNLTDLPNHQTTIIRRN
jgi:hypothetical protein